MQVNSVRYPIVLLVTLKGVWETQGIFDVDIKDMINQACVCKTRVPV